MTGRRAGEWKSEREREGKGRKREGKGMEQHIESREGREVKHEKIFLFGMLLPLMQLDCCFAFFPHLLFACFMCVHHALSR